MQLWVALIAAAAVIITTSATIIITYLSAQRQRELALVVSALDHLVGKTQNRSTGIAALKILAGPPRRDGSGARRHWRRYAPATGQLLYSQLVYILLHGTRRTKAHEVANAIAIGNWLLDEPAFEFTDDERIQHLDWAMRRYTERAKHSTNYRADSDSGSVDMLIDRINTRWRPILGALAARAVAAAASAETAAR